MKNPLIRANTPDPCVTRLPDGTYVLASTSNHDEDPDNFRSVARAISPRGPSRSATSSPAVTSAITTPIAGSRGPMSPPMTGAPPPAQRNPPPTMKAPTNAPTNAPTTSSDVD
jgi:hypothetical protein